MKKILILVWVMLALMPAAPAAVGPLKTFAAPTEVTPAKPAGKKAAALYNYANKHPRLQQLALKLTQKKWFQKWMAKADEKQRTKDIMGTIAVVAGGLLILSVFTVPAAALVLVPAAIVCGIIGVTRNPNRKSYTLALIGLILGGLYLVAILLLLALALAWTNGW